MKSKNALTCPSRTSVSGDVTLRPSCSSWRSQLETVGRPLEHTPSNEGEITTYQHNSLEPQVGFNFENVCWVEITWNPIDSRWDAVRPAGQNYNCDIDTRGLPTREQWGHIDGQPEEEPSTSEPRTPAPSETSGDDNEDSESDQEEPETNEIAQTAESLHITEPERPYLEPSDRTNPTHPQEQEEEYPHDDQVNGSRGTSEEDPHKEDHQEDHEEDHQEEGSLTQGDCRVGEQD
ncbi:hypothetical protein EDB85DRAFT_1903851 [Lactarius pseudohatsudake]|nr:hypothetical protein EDB85DRAFT_1903851 [Lactarius pseudohatsudake]